MIPHHLEAVQTSKVIMMDADITNPEVRLLAARIADTQEFEITQMEGWYLEWFKTPYEFNPAMFNSMMSDPKGAVGDERAKIYLKDMVKHHEHAIEMAQEAREVIADLMEDFTKSDGSLTVTNTHPGIETTIAFTEQIEKNQQVEIEQIKALLKTL